jgi:hypothetical protein
MFLHREEAAFRLAERLRGRPQRDPLVLAIPRGGVVIGAILARELKAELDVVLARKLRAPRQPELAIGAIGENGDVYLNPHAEDLPGVSAEYLQEECRHQMREIVRRQRLFRDSRPAAPVAGRSVVVTDDGLATGSTMMAALQVIGHQAPHEVIVAVPVAAPERLEQVRRHCDEVVCLLSPPWLRAVGQFYADFSQLDDDQVVQLLRSFRDGSGSQAPGLQPVGP